MLVEAGLVGLVRTLLIIAAVVFVIRLIGRLMIQQRANQEKIRQMQHQQQYGEAQGRTVHDDGNVRVEYRDKKRPGQSSNSNDDEYTDFEEID